MLDFIHPVITHILNTVRIFMIREYYVLGVVLAFLTWSGLGLRYLTTAGLTENFIAAAKQADTVRWQPNPDRGTATSTLSGGRRGNAVSRCAIAPDTLDTRMTLLVPQQNEGLLTTEATPRVSWYLETAEPVTMRLVLTHPEQANPLYTTTLTANATGLATVTLPELSIGPRYRWTVFVACGQDSDEIYARSFIERIEANAEWALSDHQSDLEKAATYANAGIWYDALNTLLDRYHQSQQPNTVAALSTFLADAQPEQPVPAAALLTRIISE
ncbi:MAG: DUF928 domain-containing protein [Cyanobacteria bacterium J06635_1]